MSNIEVFAWSSRNAWDWKVVEVRNNSVYSFSSRNAWDWKRAEIQGNSVYFFSSRNTWDWKRLESNNSYDVIGIGAAAATLIYEEDSDKRSKF